MIQSNRNARKENCEMNIQNIAPAYFAYPAAPAAPFGWACGRNNEAFSG